MMWSRYSIGNLFENEFLLSTLGTGNCFLLFFGLFWLQVLLILYDFVLCCSICYRFYLNSTIFTYLYIRSYFFKVFNQKVICKINNNLWKINVAYYCNLMSWSFTFQVLCLPYLIDSILLIIITLWLIIHRSPYHLSSAFEIINFISRAIVKNIPKLFTYKDIVLHFIKRD